jgi:predicted RNase H-like nuclease (RuvC/YqgF family)
LIFKRLYAAVVVSTDTKLNDEKIAILDKENEELRQKLEDYEVTKAELLGVKYAYQETMNRLDSALRENERVAKYLPQVEHTESLSKDNEVLINQINILSEKIKVLESANLTLTLEKEKLTSNLTGANKELADLSNINQDYQVLKGRVASLEEQLEKEKQSVKQLQSQLGAKDLTMTSIGDETFYLDRHVAEAIDKHLKPKSQQSKSRKAQVKA